MEMALALEADLTGLRSQLVAAQTAAAGEAARAAAALSEIPAQLVAQEAAHNAQLTGMEMQEMQAAADIDKWKADLEKQLDAATAQVANAAFPYNP